MVEVFMGIAMLVGVIGGGVLLVLGLANTLDPWNKKERKWGIVELTIGGVLLLSAIVVAATEGGRQNEYTARCLSYGGVSYSDVCYKNGVKVELDEEGRN